VTRFCYGCCGYIPLAVHILLLDGKLPVFTSPLYATLALKEYTCGELTVCEFSPLSHISLYIVKYMGVGRMGIESACTVFLLQRHAGK
jgi:hypothetical protein